MSKPTIYCFNESGNSYKVTLLAALLDIGIEVKDVDYFGGELKSPEYLALNPRGQVPCLVDGDRVFTDSAAILVYLAGTRPDPGSDKAPSSFWSTDATEQAQIVDWLAFTAGIIQAGVTAARGIAHFRPRSESTKADYAKAEETSYRSLGILEKQLQGRDWLVLGRPTIADVSTFVYVALAPVGGICLDTYPAVRSWIGRVKGLPGFFPIIGLDDPNYRGKIDLDAPLKKKG